MRVIRNHLGAAEYPRRLLSRNTASGQRVKQREARKRPAVKKLKVTCTNTSLSLRLFGRQRPLMTWRRVWAPGASAVRFTNWRPQIQRTGAA